MCYGMFNGGHCCFHPHVYEMQLTRPETAAIGSDLWIREWIKPGELISPKSAAPWLLPLPAASRTDQVIQYAANRAYAVGRTSGGTYGFSKLAVGSSQSVIHSRSVQLPFFPTSPIIEVSTLLGSLTGCDANGIQAITLKDNQGITYLHHYLRFDGDGNRIITGPNDDSTNSWRLATSGDPPFDAPFYATPFGPTLGWNIAIAKRSSSMIAYAYGLGESRAGVLHRRFEVMIGPAETSVAGGVKILRAPSLLQLNFSNPDNGSNYVQSSPYIGSLQYEYAGDQHYFQIRYRHPLPAPANLAAYEDRAYYRLPWGESFVVNGRPGPIHAVWGSNEILALYPISPTLVRLKCGDSWAFDCNPVGIPTGSSGTIAVFFNSDRDWIYVDNLSTANVLGLPYSGPVTASWRINRAGTVVEPGSATNIQQEPYEVVKE